jgi:hypothetical protein
MEKSIFMTTPTDEFSELQTLSIEEFVKKLPDLDNETICKFVKDIAINPKGFIAHVGQDNANLFTAALLMEADSRSGDDGSPSPVFTSLLKDVVEDTPQELGESSLSFGQRIHNELAKAHVHLPARSLPLPNRKARRAEEARLKRLRKKL